MPDKTRLGVDDSWNLSNATRITFQATPRNKVTGYLDLQDRLTGHWFVGQGGIFGLTAPEASWRQTTPHGHLAQAKWTSTVTSRMLLEAGVERVHAGVHAAAAAGRHADDVLGRRQFDRPAHQRGAVLF